MSHMAEIGIRALQQNASAVVNGVADGSSVTVTVRGHPVARLVPATPNRVESLVQAGRIRPPLRKLSQLPEPPPPSAPGQSLSDELENMRNADRY